MTLRRFAPLPTPTARAGAGLALLALIGIGIAMANPEAVVASRFTAALEKAPPAQTVASRTADRTLVSGSEAYWLAEKRRHDGAGAALEPATWSAAPFAATLAVGDRITIASAKGERVLEVVAVADVEPAAESAADAAVVRRIAVTCRDTSTPDKRLVTFEIPVEAVPGALRSARAL